MKAKLEVDGEQEVDGEEEVQPELQRVELWEGDAADLRVAMQVEGMDTKSIVPVYNCIYAPAVLRPQVHVLGNGYPTEKHSHTAL